MGVLTKITHKLGKRKVFSDSSLAESNLNRHLGVIDLTALGVGSTLGVGIYVLAGQVSKTEAGPAVVISFLLAAVASVFAGLCYAEFGARVPRAGSAYVYSYVCVGELVAFVIGWNLILEYAIGAASVARGLSAYIDGLSGNVIKEAFQQSMPMNAQFLGIRLADYPDFFAFGLTLFFVGALSFGVKESTKVNNVFTILNVCVVLFVIIAGGIKANTDNWSIPKQDIPSDAKDAGEGGFFPFGVIGMIKGAATCFYGFVGFDCVATAGEETKNPQRNIPIAVVASLTIIFLAYFGVSSVLTLMVPYYLQDEDSPIPHAFDRVDWPVVAKIVSVGAIFGLLTSLFGALFPLPRVVYAMASDGIIFRFLGKIHSRFQTPVNGTIVSGILTAAMTLIFDLNQLVNMMSIGTLMAYSIVAACVLLLRFQKVEGVDDSEEKNDPGCLRQLLNSANVKSPSRLSGAIVSWEVGIFFAGCLGLTAIVVHASDALGDADPWAITGLAVLAALLLFIFTSITRQPPSKQELSFKVPLVPLVPTLSILVNVYLMMMLDVETWKRFAVWMALGFVIYFGYGIWQVYYPPEENSEEITKAHHPAHIIGEVNESFVGDK